MKKFSVFVSILFALSLVSATFAQEPAAQTSRGKGRKQSGRALKKMDANSDGKISRDEWSKNPEAFGKLDGNSDGFITSDEIRKTGGRNAIKEMDTNNNGQISRDEWKGKTKRFGRLDANNDGVITRDEIKSRNRRG